MHPPDKNRHLNQLQLTELQKRTRLQERQYVFPEFHKWVIEINGHLQSGTELEAVSTRILAGSKPNRVLFNLEQCHSLAPEALAMIIKLRDEPKIERMAIVYPKHHEVRAMLAQLENPLEGFDRTSKALVALGKPRA